MSQKMAKRNVADDGQAALLMAAKPLGTSLNFKPMEGDKYPGMRILFHRVWMYDLAIYIYILI